MIDIQIVRENPKLVAEKSAQKGYSIDVEATLKADTDRKELLSIVEELRAKRNEIAGRMKGGKPAEQDIAEGKQVKVELASKEEYLSQADKMLADLLKKIPNMSTDEVPVGASEDDNVVVKTVGEPTSFDFTPKNHAEIGELHGWIDKERASKVAGARFTYLKGPLVLLQFAIMQWVMSVLTSQETLQYIISSNNLNVSPKPFVPVLPPAIVKTDAYKATGRLNEEEVTYKLVGE